MSLGVSIQLSGVPDSDLESATRVEVVETAGELANIAAAISETNGDTPATTMAKTRASGNRATQEML